MSDIAERVKKAVIERFGVDASRVTDTANFSDDLAAASLDKIDQVMGSAAGFLMPRLTPSKRSAMP